MTALTNGLGGSAGFGESTLGPNDDQSATVDLTAIFGPDGLRFQGVTYTQASINNNGNLTFGGAAYGEYHPIALNTTGQPIIAAYLADVLTTDGAQAFDAAGNSTGSNLVWYDEDAANKTLTVTWDDVVGLGQGNLLHNAFQMRLAGLANGNFILTLTYEEVSWSSQSGTGGGPRAGFSTGSSAGLSYELPQSGNLANALNLDTAIGNVGEAGLYYFVFWSGTAGDDSSSDAYVGELPAYVLSAGLGNDTLAGASANDTLDGGDGIDTVTYQFANSAVTASLLTGIATGIASGADTLVAIENITGSGFADRLTGSTGNNLLVGGGGNDTLLGDAGDDTLIGGLGSDSLDGGANTDTVSYAGASGPMVVSLNGASGVATGADGTDTLVSIENIIGTPFDDTLTGNALANQIYGLDGNDTLIGLGGSDLLDGGDGNDMASYISAPGPVQVNLQSGQPTTGGDGSDTLVSIENLEGSLYGDTLIGDGHDNYIYAHDGDDSIVGGAGNDSLDAGTGNDTVFGDAGYDTLDGGLGNDLLDGGDDDDELNYSERYYANAGDDTLFGGDGSDTLYSYSGADFLDGGPGNDYYEIGPSAFNTTIADTSGYDTVFSYLNGYSLDIGLEALYFFGAMSGGSGNNADNYLDGNQLDNTMFGLGGNDDIYGYEGADLLDGGTGADYMDGGSGDDTYYVDNYGDQVIENDPDGDNQPGGVDLGGGTDLVIASVDFTLGTNVNNLTMTGTTPGQIGFGNALRNLMNSTAAGGVLHGDDGNDTLIGKGGNDTLDGGAGADLLTGGGGADLFQLGTSSFQLGFSTVAAPDRITDFNFAAGDRLGTITANGLLDGALLVWRGDTTASGFKAVGGSTVPGTDFGSDMLQMWMFYDASNLRTGLYIDTDRNFKVDAGDFLLTFSGDARPGLSPASMTAGTFATAFSGNGQGTAGDDVLAGSSAGNNIAGLGGNDYLVGANGADTLDGGTGFDTLFGGADNDSLVGGDDGDSLYGGPGNDTLQGGAGNDSLFAGDDGLAGAAQDSLSAINLLQGGDGNDTLFGGAGADSLDGGGGTDLLSYVFASAGVNVNLLAGTATGGGGNDTIGGVEQLIGSPYNDTLVGSNNSDQLEGEEGADVLTGNGGADLFWIRDYTRVTPQSPYSSTYTQVYASQVAAPDRITDFNAAAGDRIQITLLGGSGLFYWRGDAHSSTFTDASSGGASGFTAALGQAVGGRDLDLYGATQIWVFFDAASNRTSLFLDRAQDNYFIVDAADIRIDFDGDVRASLGPAAFVSSMNVGTPGSIGNDVIDGDATSNLLLGAGGNDRLNGFDLNDTLVGGAGDDTLSGGTGNDSLSGGPGNDSLGGDAGQDTLAGGAGADSLDGGNDSDQLNGGEGNDTLDGGLGRDYIFGDDGDDRIVFDTNDYYVYGGNGVDTLVIGDGLALSLIHMGTQFNQVQFGASNSASVYFFEALDFSPRTAAVNFVGEGNADVITGTAFADTIDGAGGNDSLSGGVGADSLTGGIGNDTLRGAENADTLMGGDGDDSLAGGKGVDSIDGGEGNDTLSGGVGNDILIGGNGIDRADYSLATDAVTVNLTIIGVAQLVSVLQGSDTLTGIEQVMGGILGDMLTGDLNPNLLIGLAGNDTLVGNEGFDTLDGGDGNDLLAGGNNADWLIGGAGNDTLGGGKGMDTLDGGDGNDLLNGTLGQDQLTGGAGADMFLFNSLPDGVANIDTITDFTSGADKIQLSASIFGAFAGQIGQSITTNANLLYNSGTGLLTYDADGAGGAAPLAFAILGSTVHPATLATDFLIVA